MGNLSHAVLAVGFALALTGCLTTNAALLGTATANRPALPAQDVALYRMASQVPRPYEEIALLNSSGDSDFTDEARMLESMREKAGELGANGVIVHSVSEPAPVAKVAAAIFGVPAPLTGKALAIWVFPAAPRAMAEPTHANATPTGRDMRFLQGDRQGVLIAADMHRIEDASRGTAGYRQARTDPVANTALLLELRKTPHSLLFNVTGSSRIRPHQRDEYTPWSL